MVRSLLTLCCVLPLLSCASASSQSLRLVDCTRAEYCRALKEWSDPFWSKQHEALYAQGVRSILQEMACGKVVTWGRRLAYVARADLSVSCASGRSQIRYVKDRDDGNKLLAAGRIDYVVEFERADASKIRGGIKIPVSASFYGRARKGRADSRLEGMDNYLIVKTDTMAEVRLVSRAGR